LHRLQKNVHTPIMSDRQCRAGETLVRDYRPNARRTDSEGNFQAYCSICDQRSRKLGKGARQCFRCHVSIIRALAVFAKRTDISNIGIEAAVRLGIPAEVRVERMKQSIALVLGLCVVASSVLASLGENSERIEDRYGTIAQRRLHDDGTVSVVYAKDRYLYMVTFANSRSIAESYSRANGRDLSEKEITKFLKANSGAEWIPLNTGAERHFKTSDGSAEATYGILNGRPALTVRTVKR